jgi:hypothetical protein
MVAAALALAFFARSAPTAPPAASLPAGSPALRVLVRFDTRAVEKHLRVADLTRTVQNIWKPYADILFADTADLVGDGDVDEIQLVLAEGQGSAASGASALGWITFIAPGRPANVVTVSVATARSLMARESWMGRRLDQLPPALRQQLITRAVSWSAAHEIGHYLLRTSAHAMTGLMKAQLTASDVMRNDREWIQLDPHDAEILRRRAAHAGQLTTSRIELGNDEP